MKRPSRLPSLAGAALLGLAVAAPAAAQSSPPPNVPALGPPFGLPPGPPFGLPGTAPPDFSKGKGKRKGMGSGKTSADVTYSCLGVAEATRDHGSPFSYVEDAVELRRGASSVFLEGVASGELAGGGFAPTQGAAASLESEGMTLLSFDACDSSAGTVLASIATGAHLDDVSAEGMADVEFHVHYQATLELDASLGSFTAYTGSELEVLGLSVDSFEVSSDGEVVDAPPGLTVTDRSFGSHRIYDVAGTYVIPGQLRYGPEVENVVRTRFFAGGAVAETGRRGVAAGFAGAEALDTVSYEIVSLDPDVVFEFVEASDSGEEAGAP